MAASGSPATPDAEGDWVAPYRVDLHAVLGSFMRGSADPAQRFTRDGSVWRAARTPEGTGTLRLNASAGHVRAQAWGSGADWLISSVPRLLGFDDEPSGFPAEALPPALAPTWRRLADRWRTPRSGLVLEALVIAVLEQKVTGVQSRRAWRSLLAQRGEPAPGPAPAGMFAMPTTAEIRRVPSWQWHRWGVGPHQSATIMRAAAVAGRLAQCAELSLPEARRRLGAVTGIGPWTVAEVSQRALGDADAVSFHDYHLARHVVYAFTSAMDGSDEQMAELLAPFAGHRYRVQRIVELSGVTRPARGPRMTIADYRRI
jgi:3-methyladenine DNA glycosylase/8-oxoguanine DNA glycosylase